MITKAQKKELIDSIAKALKSSKSVVFANFHHLIVSDDMAMRKALRKEGVGYMVVRKTLAKIALKEAGIEGTCDLWLSIFRYMRPDGTTDHVAGWNIPTVLKPGQTAAATAKAFADYINAGTRPYHATASGGKIKIVFTVK